MWRLIVTSAVATTALSLASCRDKAGAAMYGCECAFLTDTDDTSTQKVEVCETTHARAKAAATGCAQSGAPATIQSCNCAPLKNQRACIAGDCTVREHR